MTQYVAAAARDNQENVVPEEVIGETRALAARLIEAKAEEIAFVGSTSMGLAMVAAGLPWERFRKHTAAIFLIAAYPFNLSLTSRQIYGFPYCCQVSIRLELLSHIFK